MSPDGKWLLYAHTDSRSREDLWLLSLLPGEQRPEPFLVTDFVETDGMVSPDGRFVAYVSNESGTFEVYVRSFRANTGGKWRVTQTGGYQPRWGRDGKELFFFTADGLSDQHREPEHRILDADRRVELAERELPAVRR